MSKGLKQMVAEATEQAKTDPTPVMVSDEAVRSLSIHMREWSGWRNSHVRIGDPIKFGLPSPFAACDHNTRTFTVNADRLVLNPNRVLLTVTPFRLRQEAVLTGALLHEAGHARHSHWMPRNEEQAKARPLQHSDGTVPTEQVIRLARLMEEPRIEGLMFRDADRIGAATLGWTMRASAAELVPTTVLSMDPGQKIMDLITSWALRAGRQYALHYATEGSHRLRGWVQDFTTLLNTVIVAHLTDLADESNSVMPVLDAQGIMALLIQMTHVEDDTGPTMVDKAREVLRLLFPETDGSEDDAPMPGGGCEEGGGEDESESESGEGDEGDESGESGKGNTEPEDEGSGEEPGAGDSGDEEQAEGDTEGDAEGDESEDGDAEGEGSGDGETEGDAEGESTDEGATGSTGDTDSELAEALRNMEAAAKDETEEEAEEEAEDAEAEAAGGGAGNGAGGGVGGGWRNPTKDERDMQKGAEHFLRDLIAPSEASKVSLTDTPSSTVDGAALSAWKAGGSVKAPHFFQRTRRTVEPSPPVQIAVLVDISSSMSELQRPSALLSWALSSAAMDLRNFAGRGQQIESCLIHWGTSVKVIQKNGETLPGIREFGCNEGTAAMAEALVEVERQIPGFFDMPETPVNRLLVQFTDWELFGRHAPAKMIGRALAAGVNMVTVAPKDYRERKSDLSPILAMCPVQRGSSSVLRYNPKQPGKVWEAAATALA